MKMENVQLSGDRPDTITDATDSDTADIEEINSIFSSCGHLHTQSLGPKYILDICANRETNPFIATALSDFSTDVFTFRESQLAKVCQFKEHSKRVSKCKFSPLNNQLFYTGSNDGTIKLWDLRDPNKSAVTFRDTTSVEPKSFSSFDISPNDRLLAAGTELTEGDAFIVFWDVRNVNLLGAYWESHTDDITDVQFHPEDSNKLLSGSTDGLINTYNVQESTEDDALQECLNTEALVERLLWFQENGRWKITCVTSVNDVQLWETDGAEPYKRFSRSDIGTAIKKSPDNTYISKVHKIENSLLVLCGSNGHEGRSLRSLIISNGEVHPGLQFKENIQRVRASYIHDQINLMLTGGEKGKLDIWKLNLSQIHFKKKVISSNL